jgi:hypothetical protein
MPRGGNRTSSAKATEPVKTPEQEAPQQDANKEVPAEQSAATEAPKEETKKGKKETTLSAELQAAKRKLANMQDELLKEIHDLGTTDEEKVVHIRHGAGQFMNQAQAFLEEAGLRIDEWQAKEQLVGVENAKVEKAKQFIIEKSDSYRVEADAFQKLHDLDEKQFALLISNVRAK